MLKVNKFSAILIVSICLLSTEIISESKESRKRIKTGRNVNRGLDKRGSNDLEPWQLNEIACPPALCGSANIKESTEGQPDVQLEPQTGGFPFFEGDIVLDRELEALVEHHSESSDSTNNKRQKRDIVKPNSRLWKYGVVPYVFSPTINAKAKAVIKEAIAYYREKTCIKFRPRSHKDENFIKFIDQPGCWALVGEQGGQQLVNIGSGCEKFGTALHELGHTLGFWHEQSRPDRDQYVEVVQKNIPKTYKNQFGKRDSDETATRGFAYDYLSVMHYRDRDFSLNHKRTIKVIGEGKKHNFKIGQRERLSDLDMAQLNDMYYCNQKGVAASACPSGWTLFESSCYKFIYNNKLNFDDAVDACEEENAYLARIDTKSEDAFLKEHLHKHYSKTDAWRVAGMKYKSRFVWYNSKKKANIQSMKYKAWAPSYPKSYTSLVLRAISSTNRNFVWKATWTGNKKKPESYSHAYICEQKRKDRCFKSKTKDGRDYRGKVSFTESFTTCQNWKSQYPHQHKYLTKVKSFDASNGLGNHNYCRNPQGRRAKPWCFTTKKNDVWEYCDVNNC